MLNRFQYLVEVSVTALRNLQSKIRRDNKAALSLLGWKLLAEPNMTHQAWQIAYTLHSIISEPVKIIQIYKLYTGKLNWNEDWRNNVENEVAFIAQWKLWREWIFIFKNDIEVGDRILLLFTANSLYREVDQKELSFSVVYKSQDERIKF